MNCQYKEVLGLDNLENLNQGLKVLIEKYESLQKDDLSNMLNLYGKLSVLIYRALKNQDTAQIAYSAQDLQLKIYGKLNK